MISTRREVGVVGAGIIGLSTAYHLSLLGADVTVYDAEDGDARPASWGNAGHVLPVMSVPVTNTKNITDAFASLVKKNSFVTIPRDFSRDVIRFLAAFTRHSTQRRWVASLQAMAPLNLRAVEEFEALQDAGIDVGLRHRDFISAFGSIGHAQRQLQDLAAAAAAGLQVEVDLLSRDELVEREPLAAHVGRFGVGLKNQAMVVPPLLQKNLRAAVLSRGVQIRDHACVSRVVGQRAGVRVEVEGGASTVHEKVVIATGAWLDELAAAHHIGTRVLAGFGYSAFVEGDVLPAGMLYFPEAKIATTVMDRTLRVSTLLQIDKPAGPFRQESGRRLLDTAKAVLPDLRWDTVRDIWHGGRPLSATGRPTIGESRTKNVYVNGGHGMWGVTLGPVSGRLLAEAIVDGRPNIDVPGFEAR